MANTQKLSWIDNLRGLAILAVVVGHIASPLTGFIYSWHIPLFFYISGLFIKPDRLLITSLKKDFKKLILPFILFNLIGLSFEYLKRYLWPGYRFTYRDIDILQELKGIFWWMDITHLHHYGFVLWFLPALFWSKNLYLVLIKIFKDSRLVSAISILLVLVISNQNNILPFGLDKGLVGVFWLSLGWLISGKYWIISFIALIFLKIPLINLALNVIDIYGVFYSLIIINLLVGLFKWSGKRFQFLEKYGENSMFIFIIHPYINNLAYFFIIYLLNLNWAIEIIVLLLVMSAINYVFNSGWSVLKYIWFNNPVYLVPYRILYSLSILVYQLFTKKTIIINVGNGRKIMIYPDCVISRMFLYTNLPESREIQALSKNMDKNSIFLDIGANVGNYSVGLSNITKKIYAFEPSPLSFIRCQENFNLNNINKSNVNKIALSDKPGIMSFSNYGGSSTINKLVTKDKSSIKVKVETLDNWISKNIKSKNFNLLLNIDVEGHEFNLLKGAKKTLSKGLIRAFTFEEFDLHSPLFNYIKSYGYNIVKISNNNFYASKV